MRVQVAAVLRGAKSLPRNLYEALNTLEDDEALAAHLGAPFVASFIKLRRAHWEEYAAHLSKWEFDAYLDS